MIRLAALALTLPPVLAIEVACAYVDALRRNSEPERRRLVAVPTDDGGVELLPVCSCCRMRAMRPAGTGRVCPDCDTARTAPSPADMPQRRPTADGD